MSDPTVPQVNDAYWFEWSKELVDGALKRRDAAFERFQKLVLWLWGAYTTFAAVGFALSEKQFELITALVIGLPSVMLIVVYWACVWGQMPNVAEFDPRSPTEIASAHYNLIEKSDRRLKLAMYLSLLAAGSVAVALLVAGAAQKPAGPSLDVASQRTSKGLVGIALTARLPPKTTATVSVDAQPGTAQEQRPLERIFRSNDDGVVQSSFEVPEAKSYRVRIAWSEDDTELSMAATLESE